MADGTSTAPPKLQVTATFPRDPRLFARDHATILRDGLRETAAEHHRRHIPWHFKSFASAKYGYSPRSPRYKRLKAAMGINEPLVFTGATRDQVTREKTITATQKGATLIMRLPLKGGTGRFRLQRGQTTLTRSQRTIVRIIGEIKAITPDERRYLADFLENLYTKKANAPGTPYRTRRRGG